MILLLLVTVIWWLQDLPWQSMTYILLLSDTLTVLATRKRGEERDEQRA